MNDCKRTDDEHESSETPEEIMEQSVKTKKETFEPPNAVCSCMGILARSTEGMVQDMDETDTCPLDGPMAEMSTSKAHVKRIKNESGKIVTMLNLNPIWKDENFDGQ